MYFSVFYNMLLISLVFMMIPKMLYQRIFYGKYKKCFWQRLGLHFPKEFRHNQPIIWVHAVSVGETKAIINLIHSMKIRFPNATYVLSSGTETGYQTGEENLPFVDYHFYMPFDFSWIIRPIIKKIKPNLVIVSETDLWYHFLSSAKKEGAQIALVNGKLSDRSFSRHQSLPLFFSTLAPLIDRFCLQNESYAKKFRKLGVQNEKIRVTGNLKIDQLAIPMEEKERLNLREKLGIEPFHQVLVVGSTHNPEERAILEALIPLRKEMPKLKIVLVPRHPERFNKVAQTIQQLKIPFQRFSDPTILEPTKPLTLVDTMGQLQHCYQFADLAIIGGSFFKDVGGHNILEPIRYGIPVLFGPHMHNQKELEKIVVEAEAGLQLSIKQLQSVVKTLLEDDSERKRMGESGQTLLNSFLGATERTEKALEPLFFDSGLISFAQKSNDMVDFSSQV